MLPIGFEISWQTCPSGQIYPFAVEAVWPLSCRYPVTFRVFGSMYPPHSWPFLMCGDSPRVGWMTQDRRKEPLNDWTPIILNQRVLGGMRSRKMTMTHENNTMAKTTKYATLVRRGRAVFRECMMVCQVVLCKQLEEKNHQNLPLYQTS